MPIKPKAGNGSLKNLYGSLGRWKNLASLSLYLRIMERFKQPAVTQIPAMLPAYHRSLALHVELVEKLRSHSTTFEEARNVIDQWAQQPCLEEEGWDSAWEDLCAAEVERW